MINIMKSVYKKGLSQSTQPLFQYRDPSYFTTSSLRLFFAAFTIAFSASTVSGSFLVFKPQSGFTQKIR